MKKFILIMLLLTLLALGGGALWVWWDQPQRVDMAGYIPAEALVYLEANDLPAIVSGLASTPAWRELAPLAGLNEHIRQARWLSRLPYYTGIGTADAVVFSRAQVGVAVLGFETSEFGEGLRVKPQFALIVETHSSAARTRQVVEKYAAEVARKTIGATNADSVEGAGGLMRWTSPGGEKRIVAAISESVAVIGNDETAVRTCLQVVKGERPSLAGNAQLKRMRERLDGPGAITFGYVSPAGVTTLAESLARAYIERATDQRAQGLAASLLPQIAAKIIGPEGTGWSARFREGAVEDRYFFSLQPGLTGQLRALARPSGEGAPPPGSLVPAGTYQLTRYLYQEPEAAWRALGASITSRLDALSGVIVTELLKEALEPYGIRSPADFLRAAGPEVGVARLDDAGASTVTIVRARDEKALRALVTRRLGARPKVEKIGEAEMLVAADAERGAAVFGGGLLLLGQEETLRRCLEAQARGATLAATPAFQQAAIFADAKEPVDVITFTDDRESARAFFASLLPGSAARARFAADGALPARLEKLPYAVSLTTLAEDGLARTTSSNFGQFGTLAQQFTGNAE